MGDSVGESRMGRPVTGHLYRRGLTWWLECRASGQRLRKSLETSDHAEAEARRRKLIAGLTIKADIAALLGGVLGISKPPTTVSMVGAIQPVLDEAEAAGTQPEVRNLYAIRWGRIVEAACRRGVTRLDGITPGVARSLVFHDLGMVTAKTRREYAAILRRVCKAHGRTDPLAGVKIGGKGGTRRALTDAEIARLLAVTEGDMRLLILLALYTGARLGDLCRMTWANVEGDCIRFTPRKTARTTGREVLVPIHPELAAALPSRGLPFAPVMPTMAAEYQRGRYLPCRLMRRAFKAAGIEALQCVEGAKRKASHVGIHALRHTFISRMVSAGVAENIVMAMAGHSSSATSRRYQHIDTACLHNAVSKLPAVGA